MDENTDNPAQDPAKAQGITLMRPTIVAALYLANIVLGFSVFVGLVLAYVWRSDAAAQEWEKTHFTYLIRTFWIGAAAMVVFFVLWIGSFFTMVAENAGLEDPAGPGASFFIVVMGCMLLIGVTAIWFCIRCILSLVKTSERKPMPNPGTWLF